MEKAYYDQLTKYNKYSKNKYVFEGENKSKSILEQCKELMMLLSLEEKNALIRATSHTILHSLTPQMNKQ